MTLTDKQSLEKLKLGLSLEAKNGIDFIISGVIIWSVITFIWTLDYSAYNRSVLTFIAGGPMFPLAYLMSKILKTNWKVKENPLQSLGLIFNVAQLFYFSFLVFVLLRKPDYFVMTYAIITGAHFFPYAWYYKEKAYGVMAGVISFGVMFMALNVSGEEIFLIPLFVAICLVILAIWLFLSYKNKLKEETPDSQIKNQFIDENHGSIESNPAYGDFSGFPLARWEDARNMVLLEEFYFIDNSKHKWIAPKGTEINGATIPRVLWNTVGSPYVGKFRRASVVHDYFVGEGANPDVKYEKRRLADKMFYEACRADGCSWSYASILYVGVSVGSWTARDSVNNRRSKINLDTIDNELKKEKKFEELSRKTEALRNRGEDFNALEELVEIQIKGF